MDAHNRNKKMVKRNAMFAMSHINLNLENAKKEMSLKSGMMLSQQ